jgi:nucleoporin NUP42
MRDPLTNKLTMWKGRPVKYNAEGGYPCYLHPDDNKTWVHIFFPDGPPEQPTLKDVEAKPEDYTPEIAEQYQFFLQNGCWKDGVIPSVAPKVEWMGFDF